MPQKNSLAAISVSNRLSERHDTHMNGNRSGQDYVTVDHSGLGMIFTGRYCTIKGKRSGGYVLTAKLAETYDHASQYNQAISARLKKGWTPKQKQHAIQGMIRRLSEVRTLKRHREQVYSLAESRDLDLGRIDQIATAEGRTTSYDDMSMADCEFWKVELAKLPVRKMAAQ